MTLQHIYACESSNKDGMLRIVNLELNPPQAPELNVIIAYGHVKKRKHILHDLK